MSLKNRKKNSGDRIKEDKMAFESRQASGSRLLGYSEDDMKGNILRTFYIH
jgi:hypothetical protein